MSFSFCFLLFLQYHDMMESLMISGFLYQDRKYWYLLGYRICRFVIRTSQIHRLSDLGWDIIVKFFLVYTYYG